MGKYIIKRILITIPVLLLVTIFCFGIVNLAPGDPTDLYISENATAQQKEQMRENLGLNQPLPVQYVKWLGNLLQGNLGISFSSRVAVTEVLPNKIQATLTLMLATLLLSYILAIPLGIICAKKQGGWLDTLITSFSFLGVSIPNFFFGLGLIFIFALQLKWLPTGGMTTLGQESNAIDSLKHLIMPTVVLSAFYCSNMIRYVRANMIEIFSENYMRTAKAKGLNQHLTLWRHGVKNSLVSIITVASSDIPKMLGGAVVTEQIFQWPGIGQLMISSINSRDYPVLMAINLVAALGVMLCNLLADILYAVVDPRIRY
ncbi:ABC transporter permease [Enterococcus italicus]|uniref:Oligopeptide ABC transporter, permease protein AppB n=1 Tax=Enterococcus italicus (strain DSM 15952 / CCUG 50447 / LMG 22039 / TP 1.5) TaxID=888064 RepID=E6LDF3_ENTI1|nr:ABC transporter permease [Enterococcus italicus]EFU74827.1 oligopeptide ABC transporter, permease protein AppB [Enterococcus italicus DSM 15952]OJG60701.1 peptide ABC transporter permease [Enterococcus italicus DSM 15952]